MAALFQKRKSIKEATYIYWLLLFYTIAALVWWFISLQNQSKEKAAFEKQSLAIKMSPETNPLLYKENYQKIIEKQRRSTTKHISEGLTFLGVILIGAIFVYRAVKKQLALNKQQQNFVMAVTHELKTPIAISKLNIETLQKRELDPSQQKRLLQNTLVEMQRLNDLATNILVVSQMDTGDYKMQFETVDLTGLINNLLQEIKIHYPSRVFETHIAEEVLIKGDALMLQLVFSNLIHNALKYSPKEMAVSISLNENKFTVSDFGTGIQPSDKKKVFEKFYRVGNEVTRASKGTGLGLYLCRKILNDHNASIQITDNQPKGSIFTISF